MSEKRKKCRGKIKQVKRNENKAREENSNRRKKRIRK